MGVSVMTKYIARIEKNKILFIKVKKKAKALVTVDGRLYPNDDQFYLKDVNWFDAIRFQNIDSTQIIMGRPVFVDPDRTRAISDSAKLSGNKKRIWLNLDGGNLWKWLTVIAVGGSILYGFMIYAG